jgi:Uma2 family endonuclease
VLFAPFDVAISDDTVMQPDLPVAPLLAVEVLSPSTRRVDLMLKWSRFEAAGCTSFWALDFRAVLPFPLDLMPSQLIQ